MGVSWFLQMSVAALALAPCVSDARVRDVADVMRELAGDELGGCTWEDGLPSWHVAQYGSLDGLDDEDACRLADALAVMSLGEGCVGDVGRVERLVPVRGLSATRVQLLGLLLDLHDVVVADDVARVTTTGCREASQAAVFEKLIAGLIAAHSPTRALEPRARHDVLAAFEDLDDEVSARFDGLGDVILDDVLRSLHELTGAGILTHSVQLAVSADRGVPFPEGISGPQHAEFLLRGAGYELDVFGRGESHVYVVYRTPLGSEVRTDVRFLAAAPSGDDAGVVGCVAYVARSLGGSLWVRLASGALQEVLRVEGVSLVPFDEPGAVVIGSPAAIGRVTRLLRSGLDAQSRGQADAATKDYRRSVESWLP